MKLAISYIYGKAPSSHGIGVLLFLVSSLCPALPSAFLTTTPSSSSSSSSLAFARHRVVHAHTHAHVCPSTRERREEQERERARARRQEDEGVAEAWEKSAPRRTHTGTHARTLHSVTSSHQKGCAGIHGKTTHTNHKRPFVCMRSVHACVPARSSQPPSVRLLTLRSLL